VKELYIIDGYNFIFNFYKPGGITSKISSADLSELRDRLISDLAQFKNYNNCELTVVFDAKHAKNSAQSKEKQDCVTVIYSKTGQTADSLVEKIVHLNEKYDRIFVITSDYLQQKVVFTKNIYRKSIREFASELNEFKNKLHAKLAGIKKQGSGSFYSIEKRLDENTRMRLQDLRKS
jgi:uncharacterized protein